MNGTAFEICWSPPRPNEERKVLVSMAKRVEEGAPKTSIILQDFQSQPMLDFGSVDVFVPGTDMDLQPSYQGTIELVNTNPSEELVVTLDRFATKHGFSFENGLTSWVVPADGITTVKVLWRPDTPGGVRQSLSLSFVDPTIRRKVRTGAYLCGVVRPSQESKHTLRNGSVGMKKPAIRSDFSPSPIKRGPPKARTSPNTQRNFVGRSQPSNQRGSLPPRNRVDEENTSSAQNIISGRRVSQMKVSSSKTRPLLKERSPNQTVEAMIQITRKPEEPIFFEHKTVQRTSTNRSLPPKSLQLRQVSQAKDKEEAIKKASRKDMKMRRVLFDEKWMEKQEQGFAAWLNFLMDPETEEGEFEATEAGNGDGAPRGSTNAFAVLAQKQRRAAVQRVAYTLYHSNDMENVAFQVDREIASGGISIRADKNLFKDLGLRKLVIDLLFSYNIPWLRLGLETVLGQQVHGSKRAVKKMISTYFLGDPELDETFRDTRKGLFDENPEYKAELRRRALRRFLMIVIFLDRAKMANVISHPSCLFTLESRVKSSNEVIINFAKEFLSGEGNVIRHLQHSCAYTLNHEQTALDEFNYKVENLAVDLRDGVLLMRTVEILTDDKNRLLSVRLRVPAISRLQKLHNVGSALRELEAHGIDLGTAEAASQRTYGAPTNSKDEITSKDIVDGNRRKTLGLLWKMITKWRLSAILSVSTITDEVRRLKQLHGRTAASILATAEEQAKLQRLEVGSKECPEQDNDQAVAAADALLQWCQVVCAHHGVRVCNFTTSMASGRALCLLIHHYHPKLLERESILPTAVELSHNQNPESVEQDLDWIPFEMQSMTRSAFRKALTNEQSNFRLVNECANALGCVPVLLPEFDSENIPEEKLMLLFLAYLCSRLLISRDQISAAIKIQRFWLLKKRAEYLRRIGEQGVSNATKIQAIFRGRLARSRTVKIAKARAIQKLFRGYSERKKLSKNKVAVIKIQAFYRARSSCRIYNLCRDMIVMVQSVVRRHQGVMHLKDIKARNEAATKIQGVVKSFRVRRALESLRLTSVVIQSFFRSTRAKRDYLRMRTSAVQVQSVWRGCHTRKSVHFPTVRANAVVIQRFYRDTKIRQQKEHYEMVACKIQATYRAFAIRTNYLIIYDATVLLQSVFRSFHEVRKLQYSKIALIKLQSVARMTYSKKRYQENIRSVSVLQATARMLGARNRFLQTRDAATKLQALARMAITRDSFQLVRSSVVQIQALQRARSTQLAYRKTIVAISQLQANVRARQSQVTFLRYRNAIVSLQSCARRLQVQTTLRFQIEQCRKIQTMWRMTSARDKFVVSLGAVCKIQAFLRMSRDRKNFETDVRSIVKLQSIARARMARAACFDQIQSITRIQSMWRVAIARSRRHCNLTAICKIQAMARMSAARKVFLEDIRAIVKVQSAVRSHLVSLRYRQQKDSIVRIQAVWRMVASRDHFHQALDSACIIQGFARMLSTRKNFKLEVRKVIKVQSLARSFVAQLRVRHQLDSVVKIQAQWRSVLAQRRCNHQRRSISKIQAMSRMLVAKNRYQMSLASVAKMQAFVRSYQAKVRFQSKVAQVTKLQSVWRAYCAKKQFSADVTRVVRIQSTMRMFLIRSKHQQCIQQVIRLQSLFRTYLAKKNFHETIEMAVRIEALWRRTSARIRFSQCIKSVIVVQSLVRCSLARNSFAQSRKACTKIQSVVRAGIAKRRYQKDIQKVVKLQAFGRRIIARNQALSRKNSAITIQAAFRRSSQRKSYTQTKRSLVALQSLARAYLARVSFKREVRNVVVIQSFLRRSQKRNQFLKLRSAIISVQNQARRIACQKQVRKELVALVKCQATVRMWRAQRTAQETYFQFVRLQACSRTLLAVHRWSVLRRNVILVQAFVRRFQAEKIFLVQRRSAVKIQTLMRGYHAKRQVQTSIAAAIVVESFARTLICRRQFQLERSAAIKIQSVFRMQLQLYQYNCTRQDIVRVQSFVRRVQCVESYRQTLAKVVQIQSLARGRNGRLSIEKMHVAARSIQSLVRSYQTKTSYAKTLKGFTRFQAIARGRQARRQMKSFEVVVTLIQSTFRARMAERKFQSILKATITIQAYFRAVPIRSNYLFVRHAAVSVQSVLRLALVKWKLDRERSAVTKLQALARRLKAQSKYCETVQKVVTVQSLVRRYLAQRECWSLVKRVVLVQAACRGFLARCKYFGTIDRIVSLQAAYRGHRDRVQFNMKRNAAVKIQTFVRKHCLEALKHRAALTRAQAIFRGYLIRKRRTKDLTTIHKRLQVALENANESNTLRSRTRSALDWLLRSKDLAHILKACTTLQVCTAASRECCESFLETDASDILFTLIRSCNRSEPHMRVLEVALTVLVQVAEQDMKHSYGRVFAAELDVVAALVDLLQMFRDKTKIVSRALVLMEFYCSDVRRALRNVLSDRDLMKRLRSIEQVLQRKCEILKQSRTTNSRPKPSVPPAPRRSTRDLSEKQQCNRLKVLLRDLEDL